MPLRPRTLRLFSAFSPAGPKGCSKDDERVLKGCLCLCHPFQILFFRRKLLHGTILFLNFLQRYNKYLKYTRILAIKCNFFVFCATKPCYLHNCATVSSEDSLFIRACRRYNKYLKYTRILAIKCNFICILCSYTSTQPTKCKYI